MLTFKQLSAREIEIGLCMEDIGRYKTRPGEVCSLPLGTMYQVGNKWQWDMPIPFWTHERLREIAHKVFNLQRGLIASVPDTNKPTNFKDSWQQMPNVEKGHETIKAAAVKLDKVKESLANITGTPNGWTWDDELGDYIKLS